MDKGTPTGWRPCLRKRAGPFEKRSIALILREPDVLKFSLIKSCYFQNLSVLKRERKDATDMTCGAGDDHQVCIRSVGRCQQGFFQQRSEVKLLCKPGEMFTQMQMFHCNTGALTFSRWQAARSQATDYFAVRLLCSQLLCYAASYLRLNCYQLKWELLQSGSTEELGGGDKQCLL